MKTDYIKIVVIGIVLFFLTWGICLMIGAVSAKHFFTNHLSFTSLNQICFVTSLILIILYFIISLKYSKQLHATIDSTNEESNILKRDMHKFELALGVGFTIYFFISYAIYMMFSQKIGKVLLLSSAGFALVEIYIRKHQKK